MPPALLIDPLSIDTQNPLRDLEDVRSHNRQRFEMEMLDGIAILDTESLDVEILDMGRCQPLKEMLGL